MQVLAAVSLPKKEKNTIQCRHLTITFVRSYLKH